MVFVGRGVALLGCLHRGWGCVKYHDTYCWI